MTVSTLNSRIEASRGVLGGSKAGGGLPTGRLILLSPRGLAPAQDSGDPTSGIRGPFARRRGLSCTPELHECAGMSGDELML